MGFVAAELDGITLIFAYFSPNKSMAEFKAWLAGDLNAKSGRFGSAVTNAYGRVLEEFLDATELVPINTEDEWASGNRNGRSLIDVTMAGVCVCVSRWVREWKVEVAMESESYHRYISYRLARRGGVPSGSGNGSVGKAGWIVNQKVMERMRYVKVQEGLSVAEILDEIVREISGVCDDCFRKRDEGNRRGKKATY
ncbi:uncharacterized protein [Euwallacea similis]|uniref:uncharacterized protein n=1 Tax=Euwallacea similis TaxID=1736056 RepID=UPI00344FD110